MRKFGSNSWVRLAVCVTTVLMCIEQVACQTNVTNCDVTTNNNNTICCLQLCNITQYLGDQCLEDCPQNMTKQNVTKSASMFNCPATGNDKTNSSDTEVQFDILCWDVCPNGTFQDDGWCNTCHEECNACTGFGNSASNCTCKNVIKNGACVSSCGSGYYNNNNGACLKCNDLCRNCNDSGSDVTVCTCKLTFNNTCVDSCQSGYENKGGECQEKLNEDEDNTTVIIAAAAGGGGGLLLIIIVIVVVCCCCRRKNRRKKTRMSTIIEERDEGPKPRSYAEEIELPTRIKQTKQKNKRPNYENMEARDDSVIAAGAQKTLDKKYRYVKDPTETMKREQEKHVNDEADEQELYVNNDTVKRHKNIGDKVSQKWKQSKKSIKNRFSRAGNSKNSKFQGESNNAFEPDPSSETGGGGSSYMDMSSVRRPQVETTQEEYMDLNPTDRQNTELDQEDYEELMAPTSSHSNVNTGNAQEDDEQEVYENYAKSDEVVPNDNDDLEDYENFQPDLIRNQTIKAQTSPHETQPSVDNDDDLEDYENSPPKVKFDDEPTYQNVSSFRKPPP